MKVGDVVEMLGGSDYWDIGERGVLVQHTNLRIGEWVVDIDDDINFALEADFKLVETSPDTIYKRAVDTFGAHQQAIMAMGECGELIADLNRYFNQNRDDVEENLIEEIADVEIMLAQMRSIFGDERVDAAKRKKLEKLKRKVDGNGC